MNVTCVKWISLRLVIRSHPPLLQWKNWWEKMRIYKGKLKHCRSELLKSDFCAYLSFHRELKSLQAALVKKLQTKSTLL